MQLSLSGLPGQLLAAIVTLLAAALWRCYGFNLYFRICRSCGLTHFDGLPSVLDTIRTGAEFKPVTLLVTLNDGLSLYCDDPASFNSCPFGPCLIGKDGSVALYVTHTQSREQSEWAETGEDARKQITIIPAGQVKLIEVQIGK